MVNRFRQQLEPASRVHLSFRACSLMGLLFAALVLALAGCGGGGGGGLAGAANGSSPVTVTFQLVDATHAPADGTVTINSRTINSTATRAIVDNLTPGTYAVTFVVNGVSTTATVTIGSEAGQSYLLTAGVTGVSGNGVSVTGRIFLNSGDLTVSNCNAASSGLSAPLLVRVYDLNAVGQPIVASITKASQTNSAENSKGTYIISGIPGPGTYRVQVRQTTGSPSPYTGTSASFTVAPGQTVISGIDICANPSDTSPPNP